MASLIEELIITLKNEHELYQELIPIARDKTKIIIKNDLMGLQKVTEQEQLFIEKINGLEHKREEVITNIGTVMGKDPKTIHIKDIIMMLEKQPKEQTQLSVIHDSLKREVQSLIEINNHNKSLIRQSLEMIEFNMNFIQSTRMAPGNNTYTKGASTYEAQSQGTRMFDAKQ